MDHGAGDRRGWGLLRLCDRCVKVQARRRYDGSKSQISQEGLRWFVVPLQASGERLRSRWRHMVHTVIALARRRDQMDALVDELRAAGCSGIPYRGGFG